MQKELSVEPRMTDVRHRFLHHFAEIFGYANIVKGIEQSGDSNGLNYLNLSYP
jgi:hypothetical protein